MAPEHGRHRLCAVQDIPDGHSKGFEFEGERGLFAIRQGISVYVYRNICPHAGMPLNWAPDRFLDKPGEHILCTSHGAMFEIATGNCIAGPCAGASLQRVPVSVKDGQVWLT